MPSEKIDRTRGNIQLEVFVVGPLFTNCYILYDSECCEGVLVDPGEYDERVTAFISKKRLDIKYILNTHGHADHVAGNAFFGFPVYIHEKDKICLTEPSRSLAALFPGDIPVPEDIRTFSDGDMVSVGCRNFRILHTPGHTPGGVSIDCGSFIISGDTLFRDGVGRTDLPGGDFQDLVRSIREKLFVLPDDVEVFPGHGPSTTIGHEKINNTYV